MKLILPDPSNNKVKVANVFAGAAAAPMETANATFSFTNTDWAGEVKTDLRLSRTEIPLSMFETRQRG